MRVELNVPDSVTEPSMVKHQPALGMALRPGSIEVGLRRSEMIRLSGLVPLKLACAVLR